MKSPVSYFEPWPEVTPVARRKQRFWAVHAIASLWLIAGEFISMFNAKLDPTSPAHADLRSYQIGCSLIALAIWSVLVAVSYTTRERSPQ